MIRRTHGIVKLMVVALLGSCAPAGGVPAPRASVIFQPAPAEREVLIEALTGVLEELSRLGKSALPEGESTVCVEVRTSSGSAEPDSAFLKKIPSLRQIVPRSACPPGYDTGFLLVTREGTPAPRPRRPDGYINPQVLEVAVQHYFLPDSARFDLQIGQGTRTAFFVCRVVRAEGGWSRKCRHTDSAIF